MIVIPDNFYNNPAVDKRFLSLIAFVNNLEEDLEYPICSIKEEYLTRLRQAENELIKDGYL